MAQNDSAETTDEATGTVVGRRKAARYVVPFAVAGMAAVTIGLVPALADSGDPELQPITAQELIEKIASSDEQQLSGTLKISSDLGIPSIGGLAGSFAQGASGADSDSGSSAAPDTKLVELASGTHTLRVAADGPDKQRLSILGDGSEYSLIHNAGEVWAYDSESNAVYHAKTDGARTDAKSRRHKADGVPTTPKELAEQVLAAAGATSSVTVDGTAQVAGRDAYQLLIKPKQSGSTIGSIRVAVDARNGVPLKFTLSPSSGGKAAIDVAFTKVDFNKPDASSFSFTPPKGAAVTEGDERGADGLTAGAAKNGKADKSHDDLGAPGDFEEHNVIGEGWNAIAVIEVPGGGAGLPTQGSGSGAGDRPAQAQQFLDALGDKVSGDFGSGTVFRTRLVNALLTDDGKVYVGAVTKDALVKAANTAE